MSAGGDAELGLRIDANNNRFCIHRTTLKAIGCPEFITLGIRPKRGKLIVMAYTEGLGQAIRVDYTNTDSFCIHSKFLMESIRSYMPQIQVNGSYRLNGKKMENIAAVAFDMTDILVQPDVDGEKNDEANIKE